MNGRARDERLVDVRAAVRVDAAARRGSHRGDGGGDKFLCFNRLVKLKGYSRRFLLFDLCGTQALF